jgi:hypothetical protein
MSRQFAAPEGPMRKFKDVCLDAAKVFAVMSTAIVIMAAMLLATY